MKSVSDLCSHISKITVAWGEMDALQHVNNVAYFRYFETARIGFFEQHFPLESMYRHGLGPVISENQARYKRPVTYPDVLHVGVRVTDIHPDRFTLHYEVFSEAQQAITTTGSSIAVMFDFKLGRKADMPSEMLATLKNLSKSEP
ncbi:MULTISPECIES: acyl-CoA thioesterase [Shewanella]|uniref:acyl-CoA thioesterase n=1 Tax=Shewanella TaxID=22 RepID=UPI001C65BDFB|nr:MULTISPECIES: thioesterase family protein [Shewanella]QYJ75495.1 acyl-CoA thioesterase [Shewanella sp. FJAT-52076]QYK05350.1 acyl-CoA thioesterase [Shewanella zhangzhouensis]